MHASIFLFGYYWVDKNLEWINIWFLTGGVLGSYLPDCDHHAAPAGHIIPLWKIYKHRAQTHSIFYGLVFSAIPALINIKFGLGIFTGYILHLMADKTTYYGMRKGIRYAFWFPGRKIKQLSK